jgi:predicted metallo-beta-lactamase superfamily hydrolase
LAKESISHCEAKHHKPWFDKVRLNLVDQRKQAKLQWLKDPSEVNEDNLIQVKGKKIFEKQN